MDWKQTWERYKETVGKAVHQAWMDTKLAHGYADHPWRPCTLSGKCRYGDTCHDATGCRLTADRHHTDMVPFATLTPELKDYDYETGLVGFRYGVLAVAEEFTDTIAVQRELITVLHRMVDGGMKHTAESRAAVMIAIRGLPADLEAGERLVESYAPQATEQATPDDGDTTP